MTGELVPPKGLRVVRVLAREARIERVLVQVADGNATAPAEVVRARGADGAPRIRSLIAVLDRLQPIGLGGLIDVFDDVDAPAALVEHRRGVVLSEWIESRSSLQAGEAVALLGPVAAALEQMHELGVAHGSLGATRVLVGVAGAVVTGFESAELFEPGSPEVVREAIPAVVRDREALRALAGDLLTRIDGSRRAAAGDVLSQVDAAAGAGVARALLGGLSQLAAATPVALEHSTRRPEQGERAVEVPDAPSHGRAHGPWERLLAGIAATELTSSFLAVLDRARSVIERMPRMRRLFVLGGGGAVAVAALLLAVLPVPAPSGGTPAAAPTGQPAPSQVSTPTTGHTPGSQDDPADAVVTLLQRREECFRELSVLCLDDVDQLGSEALRADQQAVLAMLDGGERTAPGPVTAGVRIIERLGNSALVQVGAKTHPASLLIMRSEAGWRIRDWVAGD